MSSYFISRRWRLLPPASAIACACLLCFPLNTGAQAVSSSPSANQPSGQSANIAANKIQHAGKYAVELRLPDGGLFAQEETDVEIRVSDSSQDDPVQGAPPVVKAKVSARVTMPLMRAMPAQTPGTHAEGVPGDYGIVLFFPHGGEYQMDVTIAPPANKPFMVSFAVSVKDAQTVKGRQARPLPYTLEVASTPKTPRAGEPADLTILVRSRDTRQAVTDFDTVHERQIHFMVVSADLQHFAHEHPVLDKDGCFTLRYAFPTGGEYHLFADVAPRGAGSQILMQPIKIVGAAPVSVRPAALPVSLSDTVGDVQTALLSDPAAFPVGRSLSLTFTLKDAVSGAAITDLQPYLGAMAHLMLIHQDGVTFVHSHPDETDPTNGHQGTLTFLARFPKPGIYRGWVQFQRQNQVQTATFTWEVRAAKQ